MKRKELGKKGFTLIELIVVMAVIAILVLLAAPKFLGHSKEAAATALKADTKVLTNAILVSKTEDTALPIGTTKLTPTEIAELPTHLATLLKDKDVYPLDKDKMKEYIKNTKNDLNEYVVVTTPGDTLEGNVYHKKGVVDKKGETYFSDTFILDESGAVKK